MRRCLTNESDWELKLIQVCLKIDKRNQCEAVELCELKLNIDGLMEKNNEKYQQLIDIEKDEELIHLEDLQISNPYLFWTQLLTAQYNSYLLCFIHFFRHQYRYRRRKCSLTNENNRCRSMAVDEKMDKRTFCLSSGLGVLFFYCFLFYLYRKEKKNVSLRRNLFPLHKLFFTIYKYIFTNSIYFIY